ncbi:MAG: outer membrane protein [Opitutales bacterium]
MENFLILKLSFVLVGLSFYADAQYENRDLDYLRPSFKPLENPHGVQRTYNSAPTYSPRSSYTPVSKDYGGQKTNSYSPAPQTFYSKDDNAFLKQKLAQSRIKLGEVVEEISHLERQLGSIKQIEMKSTKTFSANGAGDLEINANFGYVVANYKLNLSGLASADVEGNPSGIAVELGVNWNFYNGTSKAFGLDLNSNFRANLMSETAGGVEVEVDHTQFDLALRPFWRISGINPYLIFGIGYNSFNLSDGYNNFDKGKAFAPRIGFGASINFKDLVLFNPYFNWTYADSPSVEVFRNEFLELGSSNMFEFGLLTLFEVTESFSLGFELKHLNMSPWEDSMYGVRGNIDFHETLFLVRSDLAF